MRLWIALPILLGLALTLSGMVLLFVDSRVNQAWTLMSTGVNLVTVFAALFVVRHPRHGPAARKSGVYFGIGLLVSSMLLVLVLLSSHADFIILVYAPMALTGSGVLSVRFSIKKRPKRAM